METLTFMMLNI